MNIAKNSKNVTTYFKLVDVNTGLPETGLTVTALSGSYIRDRATVVVDAALTDLGSINAAHSDGGAYQADSTNMPGLYRIDWPDAAFADGVDKVQLCVNGAAIDPAYIEVEFYPILAGTVSWDNSNATTVNFWSDDITEATAEHYVGRVVIFTSGALLNQAKDITAYSLDTGEGKFTVTAFTEAPADNTTFIIV